MDSGIREGDDITPDFDPLLAKLVATAPTRAMALARARSALRAYFVLGLATNVHYLLRVLGHPDVEAGRVHTAWLAEHHDALVAVPPVHVVEAADALAAHLRRTGQGRTGAIAAASPAQATTPWSGLGAWRG